MTKTETLRQLAAASNEKRIERLASQIETLRRTKMRSVEELAQAIEPLAQAMAALTDETRQTLAEIERQISDSVKSYKDAAALASRAAESLNRAGSRMEWTHYTLAALIGALSAMLVTGFWLWVAPPRVQNLLDARAVAELLAPHLTGATGRSNNK